MGDRPPQVEQFKGIDIVLHPSPSHEPRPSGIKVDTIVIHHTGTWADQSALRTLTDPHSKVSCHFMIDEGGLIYQLVATNRLSWHAGASMDDRKREKVNQFSIGIELVNRGNGFDHYEQAQLDSLRRLIRALKERHPLKYIVSHARIARPLGRKIDPADFPWDEVRGLGLTVEP